MGSRVTSNVAYLVGESSLGSTHGVNNLSWATFSRYSHFGSSLMPTDETRRPPWLAFMPLLYGSNDCRLLNLYRPLVFHFHKKNARIHNRTAAERPPTIPAIADPEFFLCVAPCSLPASPRGAPLPKSVGSGPIELDFAGPLEGPLEVLDGGELVVVTITV